MNLNDVVANKCQPPVGCNNLAILIQICLWHLLNQCHICSTKWLTLVPWKDVDIWILKVCPRAHAFPFDSKVLALRRGIMQIDHFALHHGCWLGWYSGWSNSKVLDSEAESNVLLFDLSAFTLAGIPCKVLSSKLRLMAMMTSQWLSHCRPCQHVGMPRIKSAEFRPIRVQNVPIHHQSQMSHLDAFWVANEWQGISSVTLTFAT